MKPDDPNIRWVEAAAAGPAGQELPAAVRPGPDHDAAAPVPPQEDTVQSPEGAARDPRSADLSRRAPAEPGRAGAGEVRGLFPLRHGLPGPLHRHRGAESPWPDREKYPQVFTIDELRCIYLRHVRRGLPGRRHRADELLRPDRARAARR